MTTIKNIEINLNGISVGSNHHPYVIAEIGQNHNGDINLAKQLIEMAYRCGANAVKFQKRDIQSELTRDAYNQTYDNPNSFGKTYGAHREYLEFNEDQHRELKECALKYQLTYFCTPCDIPSLEMMEKIVVPFYKIASRDLTNIPLLEAMGKLDKPIIMSTGMATYEDIDDAIHALNLPDDKLIIMHCTSEYPCKLENAHLNVIKTLRKKYGYLVGYSDHTSGIIISVAALLLGACIIEKHITLNRSMKGTDQAGSLEELGLNKLIEYIDAINKSMGSSEKILIQDVKPAIKKLAKSITSKVDINKGKTLTDDMLCLKSPGSGILWRERNEIVGKKAKKYIEKDTTLFKKDFI